MHRLARRLPPAPRRVQHVPAVSGPFLGRVGELLSLAVDVLRLTPVRAHHGLRAKTIVEFRSGASRLTWIAHGRKPPAWCQVGRSVAVRATVLAHTEIGGDRRTLLTQVSEIKDGRGAEPRGDGLAGRGEERPRPARRQPGFARAGAGRGRVRPGD